MRRRSKNLLKSALTAFIVFRMDRGYLIQSLIYLSRPNKKPSEGSKESPKAQRTPSDLRIGIGENHGYHTNPVNHGSDGNCLNHDFYDLRMDMIFV